MAQRTVLVDDFDESEATQTVEFGYRGRQYAIDLNDEHAEEFDSLLSRLCCGRPGYHAACSAAITDPAGTTEWAQKCAGNREDSGAVLGTVT